MLNFEKDVAKIGGWLTKSEAEFLYDSAKKISMHGKIVEIGSWKGRSTICLGLGAKDGKGATVYAIDPHSGSSEQRRWFGKVDTFNEFLNNIKEAGVGKYIIPIKKTSEEAAAGFDGEADFVFVDGAHEYKYVRKDYELWFPKLTDGGLIAFHDCWHTSGVHFLTALVLLTSTNVRKPRLLDTLTIMEKVSRNSFLDRLYNIIFIVFRLLFGWIGTLKINLTGTVTK